MEAENEDDISIKFERNIRNIVPFFKIILITLTIILIYFLLKIKLNNPRRIRTKNKNYKLINSNNTSNDQNINFNSTNNYPDIYPKYKELKNIIEYEYIFFNSFKIFNFFRKVYFSIDYMDYIFSNAYNLIKLEYTITLYDINKTLLIPSELSLYHDFHFTCFIEVEKTKTIIYSLANIYQNKYLKCTEYFYLNEKDKVKFGLKIFRGKTFFQIYFYSNDIININDNKHINDTLFNPDEITNSFKTLVDEIKSNYMNKPYSLKKAYVRKPIIDLRRNLVRDNCKWLYRHFYDTYYCYCVGYDCFQDEINQSCKYLYYISIIDNERDLYPKTDYIFVDFIFKSLTADDTYPVFQEMMSQNQPAHYITEKENIYDEYCHNSKHCTTIIPINEVTYFKYGDFFEKYLTLVLKTKAFISCRERHFHRIEYLFYRIEYVTYIAVGHGVCYFKDYLFDNDRIYGSNRNNKIIIPPSEILVSIAINHGWKEENIIKINLPRWDRYNYPEKQIKITEIFKGTITSNSILIMFTWRMNKKSEFNLNISPYYIKNLTLLLQNKDLQQELTSHNMTLYVSFHRYMKESYQTLIKKITRSNKNIVILEQNDLAECLSKTNLVVSDFSSVIFDLMYRKKPFIIYVPDSNDPKINDIYTDDYVSLINRMKRGEFNVENKCDTVQETVDKIIFYIRNNFKIDDKLKKFFDIFNFKVDNSISKFIKYLQWLQ